MWMGGLSYILFFFKQKTAYEMRISDWSSDVCSSDLMKGPRSEMNGDLRLLLKTMRKHERAYSGGSAGRRLADRAIGERAWPGRSRAPAPSTSCSTSSTRTDHAVPTARLPPRSQAGSTAMSRLGPSSKRRRRNSPRCQAVSVRRYNPSPAPDGERRETRYKE